MMIYEMNGRLYESMIDAQALLSRATKHGFVRTMERSGRSDQQAARMIANAWARGKSAEQLPQTWQRRYLAHCDSLLSDGSTNLRVYDEYLFIFSAAGRLITMYALPKGFGRKRVYDGKTRVRNARRYARNYARVRDCAADCEPAI